jgi:hypothetical protein
MAMLARQPGFSAVVTLVIAVGIGATTSLFTVVWSVLLKPLPFDHPTTAREAPLSLAADNKRKASL